MLLKLPDGNWIDPRAVDGLQCLTYGDLGPRVVIDALGQQALYWFRFESERTALDWMNMFAQDCNVPRASVTTNEG